MYRIKNGLLFNSSYSLQVRIYAKGMKGVVKKKVTYLTTDLILRPISASDNFVTQCSTTWVNEIQLKF